MRLPFPFFTPDQCCDSTTAEKHTDLACVPFSFQILMKAFSVGRSLTNLSMACSWEFFLSTYLFGFEVYMIGDQPTILMKPFSVAWAELSQTSAWWVRGNSFSLHNDYGLKFISLVIMTNHSHSRFS
jgi:hypothetical protein